MESDAISQGWLYAEGRRPTTRPHQAAALRNVSIKVPPQLACAGLMSLTVPPAMLDAADDLTGFKARGGKLMLVSGLSDPIFSALETADSMDKVNDEYRPVQAATLARLFLVPA